MTPSIALLALWAAEQPVVATFHTATPRSRPLQLAGAMLRAGSRSSTPAVAVSESARLVVSSISDAMPWSIPNGLRVADFARPARVAEDR